MPVTKKYAKKKPAEKCREKTGGRKIGTPNLSTAEKIFLKKLEMIRKKHLRKIMPSDESAMMDGYNAKNKNIFSKKFGEEEKLETHNQKKIEEK